MVLSLIEAVDGRRLCAPSHENIIDGGVCKAVCTGENNSSPKKLPCYRVFVASMAGRLFSHTNAPPKTHKRPSVLVHASLWSGCKQDRDAIGRTLKTLFGDSHPGYGQQPSHPDYHHLCIHQQERE
jgi:hypothetical protein